MELFRNLFEGYPNLWGGGVAHSVLILSLVIAFGIMLGKIKVAGISLGNLDTFCRNCIRSFQSEPGRTSVAFLKGVRSDIICLLSRTTSGSRFLLSIQERRVHTEPACHDGCIFRCDHHHYTPFHNRCPHYHNGRNSFWSCNQYPGTRCRTASKQ